MVGEEVDGRVLWKGGGQADFWVDFGKKLRAVVKDFQWRGSFWKVLGAEALEIDSGKETGVFLGFGRRGRELETWCFRVCPKIPGCEGRKLVFDLSSSPLNSKV